MSLTTRESTDGVKHTPAALITAPAESMSGETPASSPDKPFVIIEPKRSWEAFSLRDLWHNREVFYFLIWRDIKTFCKR